MSTVNISINAKGLRVAAVEKRAEQLRAEFPEASITVSKYEPPESRSDRFAEAKGKVEDAKEEFECLRDELQEWRDNLPEGLSDGDKASELDDAISELDNVISACDDADGYEPSFPGMY